MSRQPAPEEWFHSPGATPVARAQASLYPQADAQQQQRSPYTNAVHRHSRRGYPIGLNQRRLQRRRPGMRYPAAYTQRPLQDGEPGMLSPAAHNQPQPQDAQPGMGYPAAYNHPLSQDAQPGMWSPAAYNQQPLELRQPSMEYPVSYNQQHVQPQEPSMAFPGLTQVPQQTYSSYMLHAHYYQHVVPYQRVRGPNGYIMHTDHRAQVSAGHNPAPRPSSVQNIASSRYYHEARNSAARAMTAPVEGYTETSNPAQRAGAANSRHHETQSQYAPRHVTAQPEVPQESQQQDPPMYDMEGAGLGEQTSILDDVEYDPLHPNNILSEDNVFFNDPFLDDPDADGSDRTRYPFVLGEHDLNI